MSLWMSFPDEKYNIQVQIEANDVEMSSKLMKLQAAIKYGEEDLAGAKSLVDQVLWINKTVVSRFRKQKMFILILHTYFFSLSVYEWRHWHWD